MKKNLAYYLVLGCMSINTHIMAENYDHWEASEHNEWRTEENLYAGHSYSKDSGYAWDSDCCNFEQNNCGTFEVGADWLYWKAEQARMEYASNVTGTDGGSTINSVVLRPSFKETSGYRVFASYETPDTLWKLGATYNHLPSNASNFTNDVGLTGTFIFIFSNNFPFYAAISGTPFETLNAQWNLDLDYADLDLSRTFSVCERIQIRPNIGLRGYWLNQSFSLSGTTTTSSLTSKLKESIEAYGLEGGLTGIGELGCGFSLVGHIGGSLLYARFHNSGHLTAVTPGSPDSNISYKDTMHKATPTIDSSIGIQYTQIIWNKPINLHACWEHHVFFDTNAFGVGNGANLTMQGLTLGGSIAF